MDRNDFPVVPAELTTLSLSARRAWIEIPCGAILSLWVYVALRKESVDRNNDRTKKKEKSTRVALRKESVDRNYYADKDCDWVRGRSPQGERG